jgi:hypothetical protein
MRAVETAKEVFRIATSHGLAKDVIDVLQARTA